MVFCDRRKLEARKKTVRATSENTNVWATDAALVLWRLARRRLPLSSGARLAFSNSAFAQVPTLNVEPLPDCMDRF